MWGFASIIARIRGSESNAVSIIAGFDMTLCIICCICGFSIMLLKSSEKQAVQANNATVKFTLPAQQ
jgi:hypothetical protein